MKKAIYQNITIIAFDADDTLWDNESHFRRVEKEFSLLFAKYGTQDEIITKLSDIEIGNIPQYGYGSKSFMLSLIEAAIEITNRQLSALELEQILQMGQSILSHSITLLPNVKEVLQKLQGNYKIVMASKGDLIEQRKKLDKSGLAPYFDHIEIMIEKDCSNYKRLLKILQIEPENFLMIGNSPKSDIFPVLEIGSNAIHVPYHTTWIHEQTELPTNHRSLTTVNNIKEILDLLNVD